VYHARQRRVSLALEVTCEVRWPSLRPWNLPFWQFAASGCHPREPPVETDDPGACVKTAGMSRAVTSE
jgi:hypothetical protein